MSDIEIIAANEEMFLFGDGIATQSVSIKKATKAAKYRVTQGAIDEFIGHLQDEPTKISVDMIVHDVIDFKERKIIATALDTMEALEDSRKGSIENRKLWTLYTGLKDDAPDRYGLSFTETAKTSFASFKNLMIESIDYNVDNSLKMAGFRIRIDFTEVLTGLTTPEWTTIEWGGTLESFVDLSPQMTETPELGKEEEIKTACDELGEAISGVIEGISNVAEKGVEAVRKGWDWLTGLIPDRLCPTSSEILAFSAVPWLPPSVAESSMVINNFVEGDWQ